MTHALQSDRTAFLALKTTTAIQLHDYRDWHRGRTTYAVWVITFEEPDILAQMQRARTHFADMLYNPWVREPHVTIFVNGFWVDTPQWDDDYTPVQYNAQQQGLRQLALPAFTIELGAINSFASALYFEVHDIEQGIATLRQALQEVMPELRWAPYVPHVTIGVYREELATDTVVNRIQQFAHPSPLRKRVQHVTLTTYAAQENQGPLYPFYRHALEGEEDGKTV